MGRLIGLLVLVGFLIIFWIGLYHLIKWAMPLWAWVDKV